MTTINEVAQLAGVSLATVSRVINNSDKVRETTKNKVQAAINELGFRPNNAARSLASNRTNTIGMLVSELDGPFYGPLMSGVEEITRLASKQLLLVAGHGSEHTEKEAVEYLLGCNCDAFIIHAETLSDAYLVKLAQSEQEIILLSRYVEGLADKCVTIDNIQGTRLATEFLIEKGHRDIAFIQGPMWKHDSRTRYQGYLDALTAAEIPVNPELVVEGDFQISGGAECTQALLDSNQTFTAICCSNDETAYGAIEALHNNDLSVPNDVSVVGFDDIKMSNLIKPRLTTIRYPISEVGKAASAKLISEVYGIPKLSQQYPIQAHIFSPEIVIRDTVKALTN